MLLNFSKNVPMYYLDWLIEFVMSYPDLIFPTALRRKHFGTLYFKIGLDTY